MSKDTVRENIGTRNRKTRIHSKYITLGAIINSELPLSAHVRGAAYCVLQFRRLIRAPPLRVSRGPFGLKLASSAGVSLHDQAVSLLQPHSRGTPVPLTKRHPWRAAPGTILGRPHTPPVAASLNLTVRALMSARGSGIGSWLSRSAPEWDEQASASRYDPGFEYPRP